MNTRIYVDFNTMQMHPQGHVSIHPNESHGLRDAADVVLYDEDMDVDAIAYYSGVLGGKGQWLAVPDWATRRVAEPTP